MGSYCDTIIWCYCLSKLLHANRLDYATLQMILHWFAKLKNNINILILNSSPSPNNSFFAIKSCPKYLSYGMLGLYAFISMVHHFQKTFKWKAPQKNNNKNCKCYLKKSNQSSFKKYPLPFKTVNPLMLRQENIITNKTSTMKNRKKDR